jgi:hypothetical protein
MFSSSCINPFLKRAPLDQHTSQTPPQFARPQVFAHTSGPFEIPAADIEGSQREVDKFTKEITSLEKLKDYDAIEKLERQFAESKSKFIGGGWKVRSLNILATSDFSKATTSQRLENIDGIAAWASRKPESAFAQSVLASAYLELAQFMRGDGYSKDISKENWAKFEMYILKSAEAISRVSNSSPKCHLYYEVKLSLALYQGWETALTDQLFGEAKAFSPEYQYFYSSRATMLLPRWNGNPGDWEKFAEKTKIEAAGDEGLRLYYLIAIEMAPMFHQYEFFSDNKISWEDVRNGFLVNAKLYGLSRSRLNEFARFAMQTSDLSVLCPTFAQLGSPESFDSGTWRTREAFDKDVQAIRSMCKVIASRPVGTVSKATQENR